MTGRFQRRLTPNYGWQAMLDPNAVIDEFLASHDLDFEQASGFYSIYQWEDLINQASWNLISNICIKEEDDKAVVGSLFESSSKVIKKYNLIPEHKAVNYFLKIVESSYYSSILFLFAVYYLTSIKFF